MLAHTTDSNVLVVQGPSAFAANEVEGASDSRFFPVQTPVMVFVAFILAMTTLLIAAFLFAAPGFDAGRGSVATVAEAAAVSAGPGFEFGAQVFGGFVAAAAFGGAFFFRSFFRRRFRGNFVETFAFFSAFFGFVFAVAALVGFFFSFGGLEAFFFNALKGFGGAFAVVMFFVLAFREAFFRFPAFEGSR